MAAGRRVIDSIFKQNGIWLVLVICMNRNIEDNVGEQRPQCNTLTSLLLLLLSLLS